MSWKNQTKRHVAQAAAVLPYDTLEALPEATRAQLARAHGSPLPTIVVLYYGGTIGMLYDEQKRLVPADDAERLLAPLLDKGLNEKANVVWLPVYTKAIDSTNGRWVHWVTIGNAIRLLYDIVDGFVVCGGTDTMAQLMAALQFMFPNIGKPIVGAAAQLSMIELGDDATANLYFSIAAAMSDLSGAHLAFREWLMHGLHVHKIQDKRLNAFTAPTEHMIGHFDGEVHVYPRAPRRNPLVTKETLEFRPTFREGAKIVNISPATPSESILHDAKDPTCSTLVLITFGAGNVRDEGVIEGEKTHIACLRELHDNGYPVVLGSPMMDGSVDSPYLSGALAVSLEDGGGGAISAFNTTGPTLEVKVMHALAIAAEKSDGDSLNYDAFRSAMEHNFVGELSRSRQ